MVRNGIALIELIIAIFVMAIAMSAVPIMLQSDTDSQRTALQQEAIMAAAAQIEQITSLRWDENQTDESKGYARFLDTTDNQDAQSALFDYGRSSKNRLYRQGSVAMNAPSGTGRRKFYKSTTLASSSLGPEHTEAGSYEYDDIDDFNNYRYQMGRTDPNNDYKFDYNISTTVQYVENGPPFNPQTETSNIKWIEVNVTRPGDPDGVALFAFACNIGETKILSKPLTQ